MLAAEVAVAADLDIVVDRGPRTVEIFIATRGDNFVTAFGLPAERLEDRPGEVKFGPLRQGTWDLGDELLSQVDIRLDGAPVSFEAMSLMVHPLDDALPMSTPIEGHMAVAVCSVEPPADPLALSEVQGYAGYIAFVEGSMGELTLQLPETGRGALRVSVRDFVDQEGERVDEVVVSDGGTVTIAARGAAEGSLLKFLMGGFVGLVGVGAVLRASRGSTEDTSAG